MKHARSSGRRGAVVVMAAALALAAAGCNSNSSNNGSKRAGSGAGGAKAGSYTIALSNSFLGNTWRQTMVKVFQHTAQEAKSKGLIKDFKVSNTSQNTATEQIAQIKSLILQKPSAILINSASPTALNPVIEQACAAGIRVVVFDSLASSKCEYDVQDDIGKYGFDEGKSVAEAIGGKGNVLMVRGVVGSQPEKVIYEGQRKALAAYPKIKIVREVVGQASNAITQQAVQSALPSLPTINGVITGGSSFGALQAFQAARKPLPKVAFDNSGEALRFWQQQYQKNGYKAVSVRTEPGQAAAAFWVAMNLLQGKPVVKSITLPNLIIRQDKLADWIKVTPNGNVATFLWTRDEVNKAIAASKSGSPIASPGIPTSAP
jgi:ribose transport system substrate-binding protein